MKLRDTEKAMIAGGLSGTIAKSVTAPLSRLTILFQVHSAVNNSRAVYADSLLAGMNRIFKEEGLKGFWKGNWTSVIHRFPYSAINFSGYEVLRYYICHDLKAKETPSIRLLCGGLSGAIACTFCYPLDLVRTRLSLPNTNKNVSIYGTLSRVYHEEGIRSLYRGLPISLAVSVPSLAISYAAYGTLKDLLIKFKIPVLLNTHQEEKVLKSGPHTSLSALGALCCGSLSGITASLLTFPADVLRRRMQVQGLFLHMNKTYRMAIPSKNMQHRNVLQEIKFIMKIEGINGFYRGILPELLKVDVSELRMVLECRLGILA
eukprot:gene780-1503_t